LSKLQFVPGGVDVRFLQPHYDHPGRPGDLDRLRIVFFGHIGDGSQQLGGDHTAGDVRGNGIGLFVAL
jgi:hypothetical protein